MVMSFSAVPIWVFWAASGVSAIVLVLVMSWIGRAFSVPAAVAALVLGALVSAKMAATHGSSTVALLIYAESLLILSVAVLYVGAPLRAKGKAEPKQTIGELIPARDQYRMAWIMMGLTVLFLAADALVFGGFVQRHP